MATLDDFAHLTEQEGQQQCPDVRTVHVRVGHDDNGVVTQFIGIEFFPADTTAQSRDQGAHFCRGQHLVKAGFFHVQDLTFQRKDCLGLAVTALFGATTGRVTLHNVKFGKGGVLLLAVGQFAGQTGDIQGAFAASHVTRLSSGFTSPGGFQHFVDDEFGFVRLLLQVLRKTLVQLLLNRGLHLGGDQLVLGL